MNKQKLWRCVGLLLALWPLLSPLFTPTQAMAASHATVLAAGNTVTLDTVTVMAGNSGTFSLLLDNSDAVASGQFRFTYDATLGVTITGVQVTNRTNGFTSTGSAYATGNNALLGYQVLFYNLSSLTIAPGSGAILTFTYTTTANKSGSTALSLTQSILASAAAQALTVTPVNGSLTINLATATATATPTATATNTNVPPTTTATATATNTNVPATATPTATATNTNVPPTGTPTATATNTSVPATATPTATATSTSMPPTGTATATATSTSMPPTGTATATATNTNMPSTDTPAPTVTTTPLTTPTPTTTPSLSNNLVYVSSSSNGRVDRLQYRDEDILLYDRSTNGWQMFFDGSDVGVGNADLDAFDLLDDGSILMSFDRPIRFPTLGLIDDSDIVRFIPTQLGSDTKGTFELYFRGANVGLTTGGEDIDAIAHTSDGKLLISVYGEVHVGAIRAHDEDLLSFTPTALGANTAGSWDLYFDGSAVQLTAGSEDIGAATFDKAGNLYLTTKGNYNATSLNSIQGDKNDIFGCTLGATGENTTACIFFPFFDGDLVRFNRPIDGIGLGTSRPATLSEVSSSAANDDGEQFEVLPDDPVTDDAEFDSYDEMQTDETPLEDTAIYLPIVSR